MTMHKVEQGDRDLAAYSLESLFNPGVDFIEALRAGHHDIHWPAQLAAAARIAERERCAAEIANLRNIIAWCERRMDPTYAPYIQRMVNGNAPADFAIAQTVAKAIRGE